MIGIYMIRQECYCRIFSKQHSDVTGGEARGEGILAVMIGIVILAIFLFVR